MKDLETKNLKVRKFRIEDAEDIYDLWKNGAKNMVTFPEEPRPLAVKRTISHRRWLNGEKTDFTKF